MTAHASGHAAPIEIVLARLTKVKKNGARSWMALCPAHEDRNPSLSISEGRDQRVLVNCHAGCSASDIVTAIGMELTDLFPPKAHDEHANGNGNGAAPQRADVFQKSYDYVDGEGQLLFQACRFVDESTGKKTFRQRRPDGKGDWIWKLGDLQPVLYNLPAVLTAIDDGKRIYVVEGEKDADTLNAKGFVATTNPMGAGKWRDSLSASLKGADVVILPDNDEPGLKHADTIAQSLNAIASRVRVVQLPVPAKEDVSWWLEHGGTIEALEQLVAQQHEYGKDPSRRTRWRLDELLENDAIMRPPPPIVPRFAWAGRSTLLAAREKAGKSTITGFVTACVSNGDPFLDEPTIAGPVLIIGLEEFIGDTARRLKHFGAAPTRVHLVDRFLGDPALRPSELRQHIEEVDPVLVIVDSLTAYSHGQIQDDNNATQMAKVVQPLTDVVHQHGCAMIIIHHATKATGRSRGSTAITAGVDVVIEFDIPNEDTDPTLRRVRSVGRVPVPRQYDVRYTGDTYVLATGTETPLDQRILAVVAAHPAITPTDVSHSVKARKDEVLTLVANMLAEGRLMNTGSARRMRLAIPGTPVPRLEL